MNHLGVPQDESVVDASHAIAELPVAWVQDVVHVVNLFIGGCSPSLSTNLLNSREWDEGRRLPVAFSCQKLVPAEIGASGVR